MSLPSRAMRRRASDGGAGALAQRYGDALCEGDSDAADAVIEEALVTGMEPPAIQSLVIAPAMVRIGEMWAARLITVADEHLATSISQRGLIRLFQAMNAAVRPGSRERVLLAAVEGQQHVLGLRMVADVLEAEGFEVFYLGADVPVADLRAFVAGHTPAVAGLAVGNDSDLHLLAQTLRAIHEVAPDTRIMLGGRSIPPALWDVGYPRVTDTREVTTVIEDLLAGPPQPLPEVVQALCDPTLFRTEARNAAEVDLTAERMAKSADEALTVARHHLRRAETFRDLAYRDPLTDLANRRGFEDHLQAFTAPPTNGRGALLTLDVDEFKTINDQRGHPVGDQVLAAIGKIIQQSVRSVDVPARVGGDEFAVLLPRASVALAGDIGDAIRSAVAASIEPPVSVSVGVAALAGDARGAVLAADTALYEAKASGRNCVVGAPQLAFAARA